MAQERARATGIERAKQVIASGGSSNFQYPQLRLKANERVRFHFLSSGQDHLLDASKFHSIAEERGDKTFYTPVVCLDSLTQGEDSCSLCERGHRDLSTKFAVWTYVYHILHATDNPDADGEPWKAAVVAGRTLFREEIKKPLLLWMGVGRNQAWWGQVINFYAMHGSLQTHIYELHRVGAGMADTDYLFSAVKEAVAAPDVTTLAEGLATIEQIFRSTHTPISTAPPRLGGLGRDKLVEEEVVDESNDGYGDGEPLI
jgi:hypothetical protein